MLRQQQLALDGQRGPPTELMVQGASNFRFEQQRTLSRAAGRPSASGAPVAADAARAALATAEANLADVTAPVCIHDLKETALRRQKQVEEREREVRPRKKRA